MNILHIADISNANSSGVAHALIKYLKYESSKTNVSIFNINENVTYDKVNSFNYKKYTKISELPKPYNKPDLVIFNEVYKPKYIKLYKECLKRNIKYIIIPHGCLVKSAQARKRTKKIIGNFLCFNRFIKKASAIQFLNEKEKNDTTFKYKKAIIAGNGVENNKIVNKPVNKDFIYIGRYDVKVKGLDLLAKICSKYNKWFRDNNVKIQLYGKASKRKYEELLNTIKEQNVSDIIIINEGIYDKEKTRVLKSAYCFIQLSRHEGQPMGILEALSYGLPCIVTYGTSFGNYINHNKCGFGVENNEDEIFEKIKLMYNDNEQRNIFAKNAKSSSLKDYNWETIINSTLETYKNIIEFE